VRHWLRPGKSDAWILWLFPIITVVDLTSATIRAILVGALVSMTVMTARRFQ